jgi:hypothetical protein
MINTLGNIYVMNAHPVTVFGIMLTMLVVPMFWFYVLPYAKAMRMAIITIVLASIMSLYVFYNVSDLFGILGGPVILLAWSLPALLVWIYRDYFRGLDQRKLISLEIFRLIGGLFLIEMMRGHVPASFALPAGIGDVIVGLTALTLVLMYRRIPRWAVILVLTIGIMDFTSALFFGFTSQPSVAQLFAVDFENQVNLFPTGLIPFFLVPYAIVFHVLSFINLKNYK